MADEVQIGINATGGDAAAAEIKKPIDAAEDGAPKALGAFERLRVGAVAAWAAVAAAVGAAISFVRGQYDLLIKDVSEMEAAEAKVRSALEATGRTAEFTAEQLFELAGEVQKLTGLNDDHVKSAEAVLLRYKQISADIFPEAIRLTADLARATGTDLSTAAQQLGFALNDPVEGLTRLRRSGVSFTEAQQGTIKALADTGRTAEAQKILLSELTSIVGGTAEAYRNTLPGAIEAAEQAVGDFREQIGAGGLTKELITLQDEIRKAAEENQEFARAIGATAGGAIVVLKSLFEYLRAASVGLVAVFAGLTAGVSNVVAGIVSLVAKIPGISPAVKEAAASVKEFADGASKLADAAFKQVGESVDTANEALGNLVSNFGKVEPAAAPAIKALQDTADATGVLTEEQTKLRGQWEKIVAAGNPLVEATIKYRDEVAVLAEGLKKGALSQSEFDTALAKVTKTYQDATKPVSEYQRELDKLNQGLDQFTSAADRAKAAQDRLTGASDKATDAKEEERRIEEELRQIRSKSIQTSDDLAKEAELENRLWEARKRSTEALNDQAVAQQEADNARQEATIEADRQANAEGAFAGQLDIVNGLLAEVEKATGKTTGATKDATEAATGLATRLEKVNGQWVITNKATDAAADAAEGAAESWIKVGDQVYKVGEAAAGAATAQGKLTAATADAVKPAEDLRSAEEKRLDVLKETNTVLAETNRLLADQLKLFQDLKPAAEAYAEAVGGGGDEGGGGEI